MRTSLTWALVGFAVVAVAGSSALAQSASRAEREYNETLRKGGAVERRVEAPQVIEQTAVVPLQLVDQFPHQGTDNPSGLPGNLDWNDEGHQVEDYVGPGLPVSGTNAPGQLDPQEAPPTYRRGP